MWIEAQGAKHKTYTDVSKLDTLAVVYVSSGNYKIVGSVGDRDIAIVVGLSSQKEAYDCLDDLIKGLMS